MEKHCQIFVFGDQTNAPVADLRHLLHVDGNALLTSFFGRVTHALRVEISRLSAVQQDQFPRFTSLLDLLARRGEIETNPALGLALLCINQLACFIRCYSEGSQQYPNCSNSYALGLCTGAFAAAAISTSQTIPELLPAAIEAVAVAFRTGLRSSEARNDIENISKASPVWSVIVGIHEAQAIAILETFSIQKGLPKSSRPYVSAVTFTNVTVSGPSAILEQLLESELLATLKPIKLPINAPYHASHIYGSADIEAILTPPNQDILSSYGSKFPLLSSATGQPILASDYKSLLRVVLRSVLIDQLRWDKVLQESAVNPCFSSPTSQVSIFPIFTSAANSLASTLSQHTILNTTINHSCTTKPVKTESSSPSNKSNQSKIAIVGYSGRFPDAENLDKFWEILHKGLDVHRKIPEDRFDVETHHDPAGQTKNTSKVQYGCFIEKPGLFDARFFNMSPRESANTDPGQRLAITTAYEALEMAGFVPNRTSSSQRNRVGIFYGMTSDDYREVNSGQNVDTYFIPGGNRAFTPGRINYHFKFSGPSFSVDTACSSSFAAIHMACNSIWRGDCDTAIAGGTNVMTNPDNFAGLDRGHFLSTTGNCNTFDDSADGYCRADAVGTIILKRLEDAEADNDPIKGVILGVYTNHSAEADSMTRPHVGAQAFIFNKMLASANVDPLDVSYIEMHGTGTQTGDAVEMNSVLDVFAPGKRGSENPLHLGSVKANVGHAESASGVTSLIKVLKMMEQNEIPPHCGIKTKINHNFPTDLKERNVNIALEPTLWKRPQRGNGKRTVFLNNFSAAGGNTALLLQDATKLPGVNHTESRTCHLVAISGKSKISVQKNVEALVDFITKNPEISLSSLAYTSTARRMHHNYRVIVSGHDLPSIKASLNNFASREDMKPVPIPSKVPEVKFVFTGQGALYAGIARQLFENITQFRTQLQRFDRMAQSQGFPSFLLLVDDGAGQIWVSWGVCPTAVIGHSLGEYAALQTAGVISASDAIFLVGTRARLLEERCSIGTHSMLAVKTSLKSLRSQMVQSNCEIACINSTNEIVLSGTNEEIDLLSNVFGTQNIVCKTLEVPFAFHSSQIDDILHDFELAAQSVSFHKPAIPYISPLLAKVIYEKGILGPSYLTRACREVVNFQGALLSAQSAGIISDRNIWVEIGAHSICSNMVRAAIGQDTTTLPSLRRGADTWKVLSESLSSLYLAGLDLHWNEYHRDFKDSLEVLQLPSYNWDSKNYWIQYKNDFCLTKGDEKLTSDRSELEISTLSTASVQKVIEQQFGNEKSTLVIESDLHHPTLTGVIQGHVVNGSALCPSKSLYADVALTIADYLFRVRYENTKETGMNVSDMNVMKPLIATGGGPQLFRASASANWTTQRISINIYSITADGKKTISHATCNVRLEDTGTWLKDWKRNAYLIRSRIKCLGQGVDDGDSHKIKRGLAYKLFSALVEYGSCYRGMQEVILDSGELEATAKVQFQTTKEEENHYLSPYWIDSLGHLAGFVMNANDGVDSKRQVFINHGWDAMRCSTRFFRGKTYQTYVRMQNIGGSMHAGDVYIFYGDDVVALYEGVKFQGVPRNVLDNLLPKKITTEVSSKSSIKTESKPRSISKTTLEVKTAKKSYSSSSKTTAILPPKSSMPDETSVFTQILRIVGEEAGANPSELTPDTSFADFGIDSLLSLNIASRLRGELGLEVEGSLFSEFLTVADLSTFLLPSPSSDSALSPTPPDSTSAMSDDEDTDQTDVDGDKINIMSVIRCTIAEEVGILETELTESLDFGEIGMDSLLSLTILARLRDEFEMELPSSLLADNHSLDEIEAALGLKPKTQAISPQKQVITLNEEKKNITSNETIPPATSLLLQGHPKSSTKTLFLFPDGSGSATSYAPLPRISPATAVYGLNCPYMKTPQDMKGDLSSLTPVYLSEIRRRQPHGPYYLGGWSAGGICAFDAAQELDRLGEKVERLILIDSPFPIGLEKLPPRLYDFFSSIGLFGDGPPPSWLLPHFLAFVDSLDLYRAKPFATGRAPRTCIIWARDGVCKFPDSPRPVMRDDDPKEMKWLLNNRTDFGPNGWDSLLGSEVVVETVDDVNHFSIMSGEGVKVLAAIMKKALE
ncbi:hypothetical protein G7Y89_g3862 [Cudoniella acicularis]|uniref:Polyketide synthase n=1 Tax=Cudoniella acicularis TaxID=354080 RepID=A0A8H4RRW7_9HELO|nr:hypothetical protein G7Y89_g3862 [Cudoniella acicularis]